MSDAISLKSATRIGREVLAGLARGRALAIKQAKARHAERVILIAEFLEKDLENRKPSRGRAGRIARKIGLSERQTQRILDMLFSMSKSSVQDVPQQSQGGTTR